ncbi:CdaR family transcriptional regulator [Streptococcus ratti]|uniref:Sugar diacid utilization regulator n=1 Tax=Streptococcus ratti TaxID=1341 RepID=A0A7X9LE61_STRRT|nr:sugar diacid recognition domain-containing protein [Streptococcus ratti]NMD49603.1 hypothetical protein [Streptococcus ratti]
MIEASVVQDILTRMKEIIHQELNFFSTDGIIIASTDPSRIGQVNHKGAQFVLEKNQPIVIEFDNQYQGAKQGINLPVDIDNQIVGVIGITGKKEEVSQFGQIIKEMTKILILNNAAKELVYNRRNAHKNILDYIQSDDSPNDNFSVEMLYGINLSSKEYTAIVGLPSDNFLEQYFDDISNVYLDLELLLGDGKTIFEVRGNMILALLQDKRPQAISKITRRIAQIIEKKYRMTLLFGVGTSGRGKEELKQSILQAKTALSWNKTFYQKRELLFTDMEYGLILHNVSDINKNYFLDKIFAQLSQKEIDEMIPLLDTYEACNGSIKQCSENLFIHKNTVQYKLNKITEKTGHDPRKLSDFFVLKLASILYKIQK